MMHVKSKTYKIGQKPHNNYDFYKEFVQIHVKAVYPDCPDLYLDANFSKHAYLHQIR